MELHAFEQMAVMPEEQPPECPAMLQPQPEGIFPDVTPPGMAYVPYQLWEEELYDPETGLHQGTLFPVLDMPFSCGRK